MLSTTPVGDIEIMILEANGQWSKRCLFSSYNLTSTTTCWAYHHSGAYFFLQYHHKLYTFLDGIAQIIFVFHMQRREFQCHGHNRNKLSPPPKKNLILLCTKQCTSTIGDITCVYKKKPFFRKQR